jgi:hypothetical protein
MLESFPTGLVAVVSDSYDVFQACAEIWGRELREAVLARDGTLVVRPDPGDPPRIVTPANDRRRGGSSLCGVRKGMRPFAMTAAIRIAICSRRCLSTGDQAKKPSGKMSWPERLADMV